MDSFSNDFSLNEESNENSSSSSYKPTLNYTHPIKINFNIEESNWSIEEEYIFFEAQFLIGNKWTFLSQLFPGRHPKQMKNHFYSSIIKTLRKVLRNKLDLNLKEIIVCYYSLIYVKNLLKNPQSLFKKKKNESKKNNVTLKKIITNNNLNYDIVNKYHSKFEESVKKQFKRIYTISANISNLKLNNIFNVIIKSEILIKSKNILNNKNLSNNDEFKIIDFIKTNFNQ